MKIEQLKQRDSEPALASNNGRPHVCSSVSPSVLRIAERQFALIRALRPTLAIRNELVEAMRGITEQRSAMLNAIRPTLAVGDQLAGVMRGFTEHEEAAIVGLEEQNRPSAPTRITRGSQPLSARSPEDRLRAIGRWMPWAYREALIGDLLEDCADLRREGAGDIRVRFYLGWQIASTLAARSKVGIAAGIGWLMGRASSWW